MYLPYKSIQAQPSKYAAEKQQEQQTQSNTTTNKSLTWI